MEFWTPGLIVCLVCAVVGLGLGVKDRKKQNWKKVILGLLPAALLCLIAAFSPKDNRTDACRKGSGFLSQELYPYSLLCGYA